AAGEKRAYLKERKISFFPVVGWAERGGGLAGGHGNSVPRFHITWGTGPTLVEAFAATVRQGVERGLVRLAFRHRVDELLVAQGAVVGVRGSLLAPSAAPRGTPSGREVTGDFELRAQAVVVTTGG